MTRECQAKFIIVRLFVSLGCFFIAPLTSASTLSFASSLQHHSIANHALYQRESSQKDTTLPTFWVSFMQRRSSARWVQNHSDELILRVPTTAYSPYAPEIGYTVTSFYKAQYPRLAFIGNTPVSKPLKGIFSFGLDTGHNSKKLTVKPSIFLGFSAIKPVDTKTHLVVSFGSWAGGRTSERYCVDATQRRFQCATLLPWTERIDFDAGHHWSFSGLVELRRNF